MHADGRRRGDKRVWTDGAVDGAERGLYGGVGGRGGAASFSSADGDTDGADADRGR